MRVPRSWIPVITRKVMDSLVRKGLVAPKLPMEEILSQAEEIIIDELMVEDRLNEEVREILQQHEREIDTKKMDYKKLFDMTKQKLIRERNLIL